MDATLTLLPPDQAWATLQRLHHEALRPDDDTTATAAAKDAYLAALCAVLGHLLVAPEEARRELGDDLVDHIEHNGCVGLMSVVLTMREHWAATGRNSLLRRSAAAWDGSTQGPLDGALDRLPVVNIALRRVRFVEPEWIRSLDGSAGLPGDLGDGKTWGDFDLDLGKLGRLDLGWVGDLAHSFGLGGGLGGALTDVGPIDVDASDASSVHSGDFVPGGVAPAGRTSFHSSQGLVSEGEVCKGIVSLAVGIALAALMKGSTGTVDKVGGGLAGLVGGAVATVVCVGATRPNPGEPQEPDQPATEEEEEDENAPSGDHDSTETPNPDDGGRLDGGVTPAVLNQLIELLKASLLHGPASDGPDQDGAATTGAVGSAEPPAGPNAGLSDPVPLGGMEPLYVNRAHLAELKKYLASIRPGAIRRAGATGVSARTVEGPGLGAFVAQVAPSTYTLLGVPQLV